MGITLDYSNWAESLFDYSLQFILNKEILIYEESTGLVRFSDDYKAKQQLLLNQSLEASIYWIGFGVGVECLSKAVLVKHQIMSITKRKISNKIPSRKKMFHDYQELKEYRTNNSLDDIQKVYQGSLITQISSGRNPWLKQLFIDKGINSAYEINTPTLGQIYRDEIQKLLSNGTISLAEHTSLVRSLELFATVRRNVDVHIYLQARVIGSIENDIEKVYIPMINLLINIYNRCISQLIS